MLFRSDEHDKLLLNVAAVQAQQGQRLAAIEAVNAERRRVPTWIPVVGAVAAIAAILCTVIISIVGA